VVASDMACSFQRGRAALPDEGVLPLLRPRWHGAVPVWLIAPPELSGLAWAAARLASALTWPLAPAFPGAFGRRATRAGLSRLVWAAGSRSSSAVTGPDAVRRENSVCLQRRALN